MLTNHKLRLLARYFASECTEDEKRRIESWIQASEKNRATCENLRKIWSLSCEKTEAWNCRRPITVLRLKLREIEDGHGGTSSEIPRLYRIRTHYKPHRPLTVPVVAQLAATLLLFVGVLYIVAYVRNLAFDVKHPAPRQTVSYQEISTKPGQEATLKFPDGTQICLNSASTLRYADNPNGNREVFLQGQAFFEVVHSVSHRFIVHTAFATVEDIGTDFDVRAWPDDNNTRITVASGEVIVHPNHKPQNYNAMVASGESTTVGPNGILLPPGYVDVSQIISWTKGELVFRNDPVTDVLKQLQRKYDIRCIVGDKSIFNKTLTATFNEKESTKEVLDIIALSLKLKYETSADSVLFVPSDEKL